MIRIVFFILLGFTSLQLSAKQIALTFDDAPTDSTLYFDTNARTEELIRKLKELKINGAMIFANPCKRPDTDSVIAQLKKYRDAGHDIGNHTCSHPRFDDVGFEQFSKDAEKGDKLLSALFTGQKFFRFPYLNESKNVKMRDEMRDWLKRNNYRNGMVSLDTDDYVFSAKINEARKLGKKIDYQKVEKLFVEHVIGSVEFYDSLALRTFGTSPKHVLLLHEVDATVMYLESLVKELRRRGWSIIPAEQAFTDKLYSEVPKNIYANNGILAQVNYEKTGEKNYYKGYQQMVNEIDIAVGLKSNNK